MWMAVCHIPILDNCGLHVDLGLQNIVSAQKVSTAYLRRYFTYGDESWFGCKNEEGGMSQL